MSGLSASSDSRTAVCPVENHIARRVGVSVQRRINALKIGQKMQDLPEELWHESFRFYVKHDPTRQGGPNLRLIRLDPSRPSLTVTGYVFNKFVHPFENRYITVREAARLQGFPDSLRLQGTLTSTQLQVGNAVPVQLARAVMARIVEKAHGVGFRDRPLRALSLFSGAGGLDIGAEQSGHIVTPITTDNWPDACATLRGFYGDRACVIETDIRDITDPVALWKSATTGSEGPDLVYGGPPCQAFSQAGKQRALDDDRGQMIFEFLRIIGQLRPPFFVMENVSNLKGVMGGNLYAHILSQMDGLGYSVSAGLLLAADFGAPQMRRRLFFVGCAKALGRISLPEPTHIDGLTLLEHLPYATVGEAFSGLPAARFSDESEEERLQLPLESVA